MNKLALYVFPLGILVSGAFFPVAILLYWVSNNLWTYAQQHIVFGKIAKEEEAAKLAKQEKLKANAPKPGARPDRVKKKGAAAINGDAPADQTDELSEAVEVEDVSPSTTGRTDLGKGGAAKRNGGVVRARAPVPHRDPGSVRPEPSRSVANGDDARRPFFVPPQPVPAGAAHRPVHT